MISKFKSYKESVESPDCKTNNIQLIFRWKMGFPWITKKNIKHLVRLYTGAVKNIGKINDIYHILDTYLRP